MNTFVKIVQIVTDGKIAEFLISISTLQQEVNTTFASRETFLSQIPVSTIKLITFLEFFFVAKVNSKIFCAVIQELILNEMKSVAEIDVKQIQIDKGILR